MPTPQWSQAAELPVIAEQGIDVSGQRPVANGLELDMVLDQAQADRLRGRGVDLKLTRVKGGKTVREFAAEQAANGFNVWRSYDEPGGIRDQLYAAARNNPQLVKLEVLGHTGQGREIIAVKLTQGARGQRDGTRPAVLYSSTQHAREWISTEVNRRLMNHYIDGWRANDREVRKLLQTTELWFILVANPDGYQYTFDHERLWRKNLRDNNGDGQTQVGDGVDPNRNFPNHWGYDEEGSSSIQSSDTYRGPAPMSEPETQAMVGLLDRIGFAFQVNWHSNGQWLLYAEGWQTSTPTADDPIYYAMSGNLDAPAIAEFHPGLSSDVLYVTNGETTDYAHAVTGALAWTPELSEGCDGCGFVFPDDDALVQAEFERNLPFASSVANSAVDPDDPKTVTGITTKPFYVDSDDPYKRSNPGVQLSFARSYGDPQPVAVIAKRSLGAVTVKYSINGGAPQSAPMSEWEGGSRYDPASVYYHQMRGVVTGTDPGDSVEVWFEGGGQVSDSFTYQAVSESGNRVLVVAAEDYTGASPVQDPAGPHFVDTYTDALAANGQQADVYDIDAAGRIAPDALGVLSHYDAVIWETGNDLVTRTAGRAGGNADRLALDELLEFRSYMNEGGKVLLAGDSAGQQYTMATSSTTPRARSPATRFPRVRTRGAACPCSARSSVATPPTTCCSTTWVATSPWPTTVTSMAPRSTRWASPTRSRASRGVSTIPSSRGTRSGGRRSLPPAASCRSTSTSSSRAGPRRGTTSPAARSTRTPEPSTSTRRSPTSPTRGSPARSPCRQLVGR